MASENFGAFLRKPNLRGVLGLHQAILARAVDDLTVLMRGPDAPLDSDGELTEDERLALFAEVMDWFLDEEPSPCSLDMVCAALGLNSEIVREWARGVLAGSVATNLRRRKLTTAQDQFIRDALTRGETTKEIGRALRIDPATVRKHRIRWRRELSAHLSAHNGLSRDNPA